jgi:hypothetical protein
VWLDKRTQNCSQLLEDGELSILEFLEVAQNFTYNPDRDALQDLEDKENESAESQEPKRKNRRVEIPKDSASDSN